MHTYLFPRRGLLRRTLVPCLLLAAACQGKSGVLTDYQGSESASDASATDVSASGSTTDVSASGSTTDVSASATTTAGTVCEDPSEPVTGPEVAVTVRNAGDADVFVLGNGYCDDPPYGLKDALGEDVITWNGADCPPSCGAALEFGDCGCLDIACLPGVIRLVPGGSFTSSWSGRRYQIIDLGECPSAACGGSCVATLQAEPGAYTFVAYGSAEFTCTLDACACEPNADGWCMVPEALLEPALTAEAGLTYPDDGAVELVFE